MVLLLVKRTQALCIHDNDRHLTVSVILPIKHAVPDPQTLGAWVDGWPDGKAFQRSRCQPALGVQSFFKELVKQVTLTSPIFSTHCNDTNFTLDLGQKVYCVLSDLEFLRFYIVSYKGNCHALVFLL